MTNIYNMINETVNGLIESGLLSDWYRETMENILINNNWVSETEIMEFYDFIKDMDYNDITESDIRTFLDNSNNEILIIADSLESGDILVWDDKTDLYDYIIDTYNASDFNDNFLRYIPNAEETITDYYIDLSYNIDLLPNNNIVEWY